MNKFVGGLLVAVLLTNPSVVKFDFIAYKILQAETVIIAGIKREEREEESSELTQSDIDELLNDIDKNSRNIKTLLKNKYDIIGRIHSMMNLKAYTKTVMNDYQINVYQTFSEYYKNESKNLNESLEIIEKEKLESAKKELFKDDSDYSAVYTELKEINDHQYNAIYNLSNIINMGSKTLAVI